MFIFRAARDGIAMLKQWLHADPPLSEAGDDGVVAQLAEAAYTNQLNAVRLLVQRGASINATEEWGMTALDRAAEGGHEEVAAFLLSNGAQANRRNGEGRTPLILAASRGNLGVVRLLVQHLDAQGLEARDHYGSTALHIAAGRGHEEVVACLLSKGAQANTMHNYGSTAFLTAAQRGHLGVVRLLAEHLDAQGLDETNDDGWTVLHWAADEDQSEIVALLLKKGAQANCRDDYGETPFMRACGMGHLGVVQVLLPHLGPQGLDESDDIGWTALHWAVYRDQGEVVSYLLGEGAQANSRDDEGKTPLMLASASGHLGVVRLFAQHTEAQGLEARDNDGWTALRYAAMNGHEDVMSYLLGEGAQANSRDNEGWTPLMKASMNGHLGVLRVLAQHMDAQGLDEGDDEGWTALHWAAFEDHSEIVALLLSTGAHATSRNNDGETAFMKACGLGHLDVVRLFLQLSGAQVLEERNAEGEVALHYAAIFGREEVVRCLLLAGADPNIMDNDGDTPWARAEEEWVRDEEDEDDDRHQEGRAKCVAVFEWWDVELERRAILARATCLHRADTMRRDMPTPQVPTYLEARVAAGHAVPRVKVVLPQSQEEAGARGKRKAAGEGGSARDTEEEQDEVHAVLEYVVTALNEELAIELLEGFHREK